MKKCISVLLATIMMLSSGFVVSANTNGSMENFKANKTYTIGQFVDVSNSDWYAENVKMAYELSLVNGTSGTTFSPNSNLTIAEAITLASRMNNIYYGNTYSFVSGGVWYQTYVDYAINNGIIKNNEYSDFNAFATRYQFAQIFSSALPDDALQVINQVADNSIPDVSMQSSYSDAVYKLYRAGILTGNDTKGTFAPNTNIQRSAVAAIVSRMANIGLRQRITLNEVKLTSEDIYSKYSPAVFYIELYNNVGTLISSGSGFFIESNGVAITNYHVIEGASSAKITLPATQEIYDVVGVYSYSKEQDWAIIQVNGNDFLPLDIGSDERVHTGQKVYAIGSPLGLQNTISEGLLSNKKVELGSVEYYQISAPISHGSSGGALLNENAQVIGITSASLVAGQNLNLAIPMRYIPLNFDHSNCKTLSAVMDENNFILPPTNIRVVKQEGDTAYIQWDKVENAEYYYFYCKEVFDKDYWYFKDKNTGEKVKFTYGNNYSMSWSGLENGKKYDVIVTAVKGGVESKDSDVFSFEFMPLNRQEIAFNVLKEFVVNNYNEILNGKCVYKEVFNETSSSRQYSIQYNDKQDSIVLTMMRIYNGACSFSNINITRNQGNYFSTFLYYSPSNKSDTPDFVASYTIFANNFDEDTDIYFTNITGDRSNQETFEQIAKLTALDMLNFTDYIYSTYLSNTNCSMKDFGFNL